MNIKNIALLSIILVTNTSSIYTSEKPITLFTVIEDRDNKAKAFAQTIECSQLREATMLHQKNNSPETSFLLETALNNAAKTKEYQAWIEAVRVADKFKKSQGILCTQ
jgi:hypothetical protein